MGSECPHRLVAKCMDCDRSVCMEMNCRAPVADRPDGYKTAVRWCVECDPNRCKTDGRDAK